MIPTYIVFTSKLFDYWLQAFHFQDGDLHTCTGTYLYLCIWHIVHLCRTSAVLSMSRQGRRKSDKASSVKFFSPACVHTLHTLRTYLKTRKFLEVITKSLQITTFYRNLSQNFIQGLARDGKQSVLPTIVLLLCYDYVILPLSEGRDP